MVGTSRCSSRWSTSSSSTSTPGTSPRCFQVLQDQRGLSVQFMLDLDGTIYQTLDAKEAAWHATVANGRDRSASRSPTSAPMKSALPIPWGSGISPDSAGRIHLVNPEAGKAVDTIDPSLRPSRGEKVVGTIQGQQLEQYDLTPQQYEALARLTATLCTVFPKIRCDYPRDEKGACIPHKLPAEQLNHYQGILGHYHVQTNKVDPGPAFQWDRLIDESRRLMAR